MSDEANRPDFLDSAFDVDLALTSPTSPGTTLSNLADVRAYLRAEVVPTPETEEMLRQIDNAKTREDAKGALSCFQKWASLNHRTIEAH